MLQVAKGYVKRKKFCLFCYRIDLLGYRVSHNTIKPDPALLQPLINLPVSSTKKEFKRCLGMSLITLVGSKISLRKLHRSLELKQFY